MRMLQWLLLGVILLVFGPAGVRAQNFFKEVEDRIGDGRKGPILFPSPASSESHLAVIVRPSIDPDKGCIYEGSGAAGTKQSIDPNAHAILMFVEGKQGKAWYWFATYSNVYGSAMSPVLASPRVQREKAAEEAAAAAAKKAQLEQAANAADFRIDGQGRAFSQSAYLGQARRVINNTTKRTAWRFDIHNGWTLSRYDDSTHTEHFMLR